MRVELPPSTDIAGASVRKCSGLFHLRSAQQVPWDPTASIVQIVFFTSIRRFSSGIGSISLDSQRGYLRQRGPLEPGHKPNAVDQLPRLRRRLFEESFRQPPYDAERRRFYLRGVAFSFSKAHMKRFRLESTQQMAIKARRQTSVRQNKQRHQLPFDALGHVRT